MSRNIWKPDQLQIVDQSFKQSWEFLRGDIHSSDRLQARARLARIIMSLVMDEEVEATQLVQRSIDKFKSIEAWHGKGLDYPVRRPSIRSRSVPPVPQ